MSIRNIHISVPLIWSINDLREHLIDPHCIINGIDTLPITDSGMDIRINGTFFDRSFSVECAYRDIDDDFMDRILRPNDR